MEKCDTCKNEYEQASIENLTKRAKIEIVLCIKESKPIPKKLLKRYNTLLSHFRINKNS
jgi:hypothetical protein